MYAPCLLLAVPTDRMPLIVHDTVHHNKMTNKLSACYERRLPCNTLAGSDEASDIARWCRQMSHSQCSVFPADAAVVLASVHRASGNWKRRKSLVI